MDKIYVENQHYENLAFSTGKIALAEYENCIFTRCDFSNANLSGFNFIECEFIDCDLSMAELVNTAFRDTHFRNCKMLGMHFENCKAMLFSVQFDTCHLNLSSFYKRVMPGTLFNDCSLREVDFTESVQSGSIFSNCDFNGAAFSRTNLEKADFRSSFNFLIDPDLNKIRKAKFSSYSLPGLLFKYDIEVD